jgi:signal transduction histidine kinase
MFTLKTVSPLLLNVFSLFSPRSAEEIEKDNQLANLRRELDAVRFHLRATIKEHNRAVREMNNALTALGHELRNPLAALIYGIELLRQDEKADIRQLDRMERQIQKVVRLADNVPDLSHLETSAPRPISLIPRPLHVRGGRVADRLAGEEDSAAS